MGALAATLVFVIALAVYFFRKASSEHYVAESLKSKYAPIVEVEASVESAKRELERVQSDAKAAETKELALRAQLQQEYEQARVVYEGLKREISLLEENLEDLSFGLYRPHFNFQTAEEYRNRLEHLRQSARDMIRSNGAAICEIQWSVQDSKREGAKMTKQYLKLILRAFNGECEAALANVSWNNVTKMEERVRKAYSTINDQGVVMRMRITEAYLNIKLDELRLSHEFEQKRYEEKEEQRRVREQMREEERAQKDFETARDDAERDEEKYERALRQARAEVDAATGAQLERLTKQVAGFEAKLDEARKKKERAISRAQLTKSGFVYVISNVGSFGERVYKIGMTRRMEPMERIYELGDASVPFPFDVHVMLYSDNAPAIENALHSRFADRSLNLVNARKEFFTHIEIDEVESFVREKGLSAQFVKTPEAREYRQTLLLREERARKSTVSPAENPFPTILFPDPPPLPHQAHSDSR